MTEYKSQFLQELSWRGFIRDVIHKDELDAYCSSCMPVAYVGYDATADSLHVGHLMTIMMLRILQRHGGRPIALMGGGTSRVGDPTDKEKSRPLLTDAQIQANINGIRKAFEPFIRFGKGPNDAIMVNNADWLDKLGYIEMLRSVGTYFTVNTMVKQDTVARRLAAEQPYTFLEFNYLLMQSYDFLELYRRLDCRLQLGGSDQWGNILGGVDLIHKADGGRAFGLTAHLVTTSSGVKMGKTVGGAVWLNAERKSAYEYWQFWRNTEDTDVGRFLRLFTDLGEEEILRLERLSGARINDAKIALANAATTLLHGEEAARQAEQAAEAVFGQGQSADGLPTVHLSMNEIAAGLKLAAACTLTGLTKSNGEARRLISQGGIKVNDRAVGDQDAEIGSADLHDGAIRISAGKKRHALIKPV